MNHLLTSFARSVRESIALASVFIAQTSLLRRSVCTKNLRQYFPVQTSHSVKKSLISTTRPHSSTKYTLKLYVNSDFKVLML